MTKKKHNKLISILDLNCHAFKIKTVDNMFILKEISRNVSWEIYVCKAKIRKKFINNGDYWLPIFNRVSINLELLSTYVIDLYPWSFKLPLNDIVKCF